MRPATADPTPLDRDALQHTYRLFAAIRRIIQSSDRYSRHLASTHQITLPQLVCLAAVVAEEGLTTREISRRIHVSASTLVGVLDRLAAKGLVERARDETDRRKVHILPTRAGREFIAGAPSSMGRGFEKGFAALTDRRQRALVEAVERLAGLMSAPAE